MNIAPHDEVKIAKRLRLVFRFLRFGGQRLNPEREPDAEPCESLAEAVVSLLVPQDASQADRLRKTYLRLFAAFPGMGETPIVLMTNLAPGVDSIAARILDDVCDVVTRETFAECGFRMVAPLPFPVQSYPRASTFVGNPKAGVVDEFQTLVDDTVGVENTFCVRLLEEKQVPEAELSRIRSEDILDEDASARRYYAAGEYLTTHCHLMICAWDGSRDPDSVGTPGVAHARLHGPKLGLQVNEGISMPHGGPLLHLYLPDPDRVTDRNHGDRNTALEPSSATLESRDMSDSPMLGSESVGSHWAAQSQLPLARFLFPFRETTAELEHPSPAPVASGQESNVSLQAENLSTFLSLIDNLERFNRCVTQWGSRKPKYPAVLLDEAIRDEVAAQNTSILPALDRTIGVQGMADETSVQLVKSMRLGYALIFFCTLSAAISLHVFSHWHPQNSHASTASHAPHDGAASHDGAVSDHSAASQQGAISHGASIAEARHELAGGSQHKASSQPTEAGGHGSVIKRTAGFGMVLFSITGLVLLAWVKGRRHNECADDYRALAEAIRVQLFWNLAGLGQSVPAKYMQRQRGELYWIRGAVRSVVAPYGRWFDWFHAFRPATQISLLKIVHRDWIGSQKEYFARTFDRHHCKLHFGHQAGGMLALSGLGMATLAWLKGISEWAEWLLAHPITLLASGGLLLLGLACVGIERLLKACRLGEMTDLQVVVACLVPEPDSHHPTPPFPDRKLWAAFVRFAWYVPAAVGMTSLGMATCVLLTDHFKSLPSLEALSVIVAGTWLVAGAMLVAWAERNLYSETAYQYHTMAALYRNADDRMVREINQLEEILSQKCPEDLGSIEFERKRLQEFEQQMGRIHEFLLALGKEALDENAEWLILHRSRPLEPVMAG